MFLRASKVILTILLLNFGFSSAAPGKLVPVPSDQRGIRIISAQCDDTTYTAEKIYNAVSSSYEKIYQDKLRGWGGYGYLYKLGPSETMPFLPPYYKVTLHEPRSYSMTRHIAVFTGRGELCKVVSESPVSPSHLAYNARLWEKKECELNLEMIPAPEKL